METQELDSLLTDYKEATEQWISAIKAEESLAVPDHSMEDWEIWDRACLAERDPGKRLRKRARPTRMRSGRFCSGLT